jgi:hypothetical protein
VVPSTNSSVVRGDADAITQDRNDVATRGIASWMDRHNGPLTAGAACLAPALYLLFLFHFASDGFLFDDWNLVPFLHSALGQGQPQSAVIV